LILVIFIVPASATALIVLYLLTKDDLRAPECPPVNGKILLLPHAGRRDLR
jgi:hypothetical protein